MGTASSFNVGVKPFNVVQLDGDARLPSVDASLLKNLPIQKGEKGDTGPAGAVSGLAPTYLSSSGSFFIPVDQQSLAFVPIVNDGTIKVEGTLVLL